MAAENQPGDLTELGAAALSAAIRAGSASCVEVMQAYLARIDRARADAACEDLRASVMTGRLDPETIYVVQAGYGDGVYPVCWGVTEDGTITDLLVDFLID